MRDDFSEEVKRVTAMRVGNLCSNPTCGAVTSGPRVDVTKALNVGVAAHISAASSGGPRYNSSLNSDQRRHPDNAIWLCQNCAKLVDNDEERFTEKTLRDWKENAEKATLLRIAKTSSIALVDGDELWQLVKGYLPRKAMHSAFNEGYSVLDGIHPDYGFSVHKKGGVTTFVLEPKRDGMPPIQVSLNPTFPDTPEGQLKKNEFDDFLRTGSAVELDQTNVPFSNLPDIMKEIIPPGGCYTIMLGTSLNIKPLLMSLSLHSEDGSTFTIPYIELLLIQCGREEIILSNEKQPIPFHLTMRFGKNRCADVNWVFNLDGKNIHWLLQTIEFQYVYARGREMRLRYLETGIVFKATVTGASGDHLPEPKFKELTEKTAWIQNKTMTSIIIPGRDFYTQKDESRIRWVEAILKTGRQLHPPEHVQLTTLNRLSADLNFLKHLLEGPTQNFEITIPMKEDVLETKIPLGPAHVTCESVIVHPDDISLLREFISNESAQMPLSFRLVAADNYSLDIRYLKWP